jgi:hypothetical protein
MVCLELSVSAVSLKPEAVQMWDAYVQGVSARNQEHLDPERSFLSTDEVPGQAARLRGGEIVVSPVGPKVPRPVPSGLIHHWAGAVFIPDAALRDVLPLIHDYGHYKDFYRPTVVQSRLRATEAGQDRFSLVVMNDSILARTAFDGDYQTSFTRVDDRRCYSISESTRIREVAGYGTPAEHRLPENEGTGILWRAFSVGRFEERDGGVYVEVEAVVLSRDIPVALRWLVVPLVRRISRAALVTSLQQTRTAVRLGGGWYAMP